MGVESLDFPVGEEGEKKVKSERGEFWMVCVAPGTLRRESQLPSKLEEICKRCTGQNLVFPYTTTRTRTECRARRRRSGRERDWGVVVNAVEVCRCLLCLRAGPRVLNRNAGPERTSPAPLHPTSAAGEDEAEKRSLASYKCTGGEWTRGLLAGGPWAGAAPQVGSFHPCNCGKGRCLITEHWAEIDR
jgi:hypothetical protein